MHEIPSNTQFIVRFGANYAGTLAANRELSGFSRIIGPFSVTSVSELTGTPKNQRIAVQRDLRINEGAD